MPPKHLVILQPSGRRGQVEEGASLRLAARQLGVDIESICAENATCGKCVVLVEEGRFEKYGLESRQEHLSPITGAEQAWFSRHPRLLTAHGWSVGQARPRCALIRLTGTIPSGTTTAARPWILSSDFTCCTKLSCLFDVVVQKSGRL